LFSPGRNGAEETAAVPFRWNWKWVAVERLARRYRPSLVRQLIDEEIAVGRLESDGDGRVRPSTRFPAGIVEALADLGEPR
jgi:hypothetical protein